jgi:hypothetical protein
MGIKANFTKEDIKRRFDRFLNQIEKEEVRVLQYLGEECVKYAREIPASRGYTDRTGHLRSSTGYMIFRDGQAIHSNFEAVNGPEGGGSSSVGINEGQRVATNAAKRHPEGLCLVVVAGMSYAVYVESTGRDVLTSTETLAKKELPKLINDLVDSINKAI